MGLLLALLVVAGCGGASDSGHWDCFGAIADAGDNQVVVLGEAVTLDGSNSGSCWEGELTYTWRLEQMPVESGWEDTDFGEVNGTAEAVKVSFTPDVVGTYVASLTVSDGAAVSNPDLLVIEVVGPNLLPVADCGEDQVRAVGERMDFDGSASADPEGQRLSYEWSLAQVPEGSALGAQDVYDRLEVEASIVSDVEGTYVLMLVVSDDEQDSEPCFVSGEAR